MREWTVQDLVVEKGSVDLSVISVKKKEELLDTLARDLAGQYRAIRPMYPWVLVRVLPRERQLGMIWLPQKHNKLTHEGVVLATWVDERKGTSELKVGQHVLFAHFAGLPLPMRPDVYRIIKERDWLKDGDGGIHSVVEYAHDGDILEGVTLSGV